MSLEILAGNERRLASAGNDPLDRYGVESTTLRTTALPGWVIAREVGDLALGE